MHMSILDAYGLLAAAATAAHAYVQLFNIFSELERKCQLALAAWMQTSMRRQMQLSRQSKEYTW